MGRSMKFQAKYNIHYQEFTVDFDLIDYDDMELNATIQDFQKILTLSVTSASEITDEAEKTKKAKKEKADPESATGKKPDGDSPATKAQIDLMIKLGEIPMMIQQFYNTYATANEHIKNLKKQNGWK